MPKIRCAQAQEGEIAPVASYAAAIPQLGASQSTRKLNLDDSPAAWQTFDAIYLINLPERTDRKRELELELRRAGLGTDDPRLVWISAVRPLQAGEFPSIGAKGCFLSHLACFRLATEHGHGCILILEDDVCFPGSRVDHLRGVLEKLNELSWALWYGGGRWDLSMEIDGTEVVPIDHHLGVQNSHCVAFRGNAIRSMRDFLELIMTRPLGHPEAGPMHVDGAYTTWRRLNPTAITLVTLPPLCGQRSSQSDVRLARWYEKTPVLRNGAAALRRLRNRLNR